MRNVDDSSNYFDCPVRNSLSAIRATRLHLLKGKCATRARIASQIQLYNTLLDEIAGIHGILAKSLGSAAKYTKHPTLS
jgi:hypothetical protein